jgi:hypothetical protein
MVSVIGLIIGLQMILLGQVAQTEVYENRIETFFAKMADGDLEGAVDYIYSDNPWISNKMEDIENVKKQFVSLPDLVGAYLNHARIVEEKLVGRYIYIQYFVSFQRQPVSFTFEFYKPDKEWMIFSFAFADDIDTWVEEKAKQKYNSGGKQK